MGIDLNGARFLVFAKSFGVDFTNTAMIGRQQLHFTQEDFRQLMISCGQRIGETDLANICNGASGFAENFFRFLGAEAAHSFDYSDYENPTHTHDMNEPIPERFKEAYTTVFDGGSLEHIFNFPTAIKNCMEMIKIGGYYLASTPANNFFGHGFYQFSPELYFTVLSEENGFQVDKIIAFEETAKPVWYVVKSPQKIGRRVTLSNSFPVYLLVIAKKTALKPIFKRAPQQSDYVTLWAGLKNEEATGSRINPMKRSLAVRFAKMVLPVGVRIWLRRALQGTAAKQGGFEARFFERMDWPISRA